MLPAGASTTYTPLIHVPGPTNAGMLSPQERQRSATPARAILFAGQSQALATDTTPTPAMLPEVDTLAIAGNNSVPPKTQTWGYDC
jgi:hypothetical protein